MVNLRSSEWCHLQHRFGHNIRQHDRLRAARLRTHACLHTQYLECALLCFVQQQDDGKLLALNAFVYDSKACQKRKQSLSVWLWHAHLMTCQTSLQVKYFIELSMSDLKLGGESTVSAYSVSIRMPSRNVEGVRREEGGICGSGFLPLFTRRTD